MATAGKVIKSKAAVLYEVGKPFVVEMVDVAPPQKNEVRVKIIASGFCHTDTSAQHGLYYPFPCGPIILGHEGAGIVESIGPGVTTLKPGDHVIPLYVPHCGKCRTCQHPSRSNQCEAIKALLGNSVMTSDGKTRFSKDGKDIFHFFLTSTFTQYTVVDEMCVAKINPAASLEKVGLIGCGIPTGYGAAVNTAKVHPGSTCVVFGLGGVGLAAVMGCKNAGAKRIIGVDRNDDKMALAKQFGCTDVINSRNIGDKPIEDVIQEMTGGGADYAIECIGTLATMQSAIDSTHPSWGQTVFVGVGRLTEPLPLQYTKLVFGRRLMGTAFGAFRGNAEIPDLVEDYLKGKLKVDEFITHTLPLDKINDVPDLMRTGKCVRVMITMW